MDYPKINFFKFFKRQIINPSEKLDILKAFLVVYKPVNQVQDTQADAFFGHLPAEVVPICLVLGKDGTDESAELLLFPIGAETEFYLGVKELTDKYVLSCSFCSLVTYSTTTGRIIHSSSGLLSSQEQNAAARRASRTKRLRYFIVLGVVLKVRLIGGCS